MPRVTPEEALQEFTKTFRSGSCYREYTADDDSRLAARIPDVMRLLLQRDGFCSYRDQTLWICDPDDWTPAVEAWFPDAPAAPLFARSAFGDLFVRGETMLLAMVHEATTMPSSGDPNLFFAYGITDKSSIVLKDIPRMVKSARKVAGNLESDEMYAYVPALALGGSRGTSSVERVKAREQLVILSQLVPIRRM